MAVCGPCELTNRTLLTWEISTKRRISWVFPLLQQPSRNISCRVLPASLFALWKWRHNSSMVGLNGCWWWPSLCMRVIPEGRHLAEAWNQSFNSAPLHPCLSLCNNSKLCCHTKVFWISCTECSVRANPVIVVGVYRCPSADTSSINKNADILSQYSDVELIVVINLTWLNNTSDYLKEVSSNLNLSKLVYGAH